MPNTLKPAPSLHPDRLRCVSVFSKLPEKKLQWLIEQSKDIQLQPSQLLRSEGEPADCVFVLLEGRLHQQFSVWQFS
ncbi:MAG: hypothetical protein HC769_36415 [Cyanobacteria bacterium CRU_2_1]|nr:hypothetical protein [Cyanobacteria bacterium CRU_2_1]